MQTKTKLLLGAMTPRELAAGRYLRDGEGHPPAPAAEVNPAEDDEPSEPAAQPAEKKTTDELYDDEYGSVADEDDDDPDSDEGGDDGEGDDDVAADEPSKPEGASVEERLAQLESEKARLEAQLEEARRPREAKEPPKEEGKGEDDQDEGPKAPDPADYEFGDADAKFISDLAEFRAEQRVNQLMKDREAEQSIVSEYEAINQRYEGAVKDPAIAETYPDYEDVVNKGASEKKWACTPEMAILIKRSEFAPHVAYELATNAKESARLASLDPQELLLEFGRLEGRVSSKISAPSATPAPKHASDAPAPPPARARGSGGKFSTEQDALYDRMLAEYN